MKCHDVVMQRIEISSEKDIKDEDNLAEVGPSVRGRVDVD